ncbi:MAG: transcriptional regulator NrdR [Thermodesulfobacteriota bacterium]|nr:transcriptional regulator NrdR [Thermodesulfobacteriota bacterium]
MKCPFCGHVEDKVIDSRVSKDNLVIRRRRECFGCQSRFTTYERVEEFMPLVVKKDGRREPFNRTKVVEGLKKACEKRPISINLIEEFVDGLEKTLQEMGEKEIPCSVIGEKVMAKLREWDEVAYVRFASVYKQFKDLDEFMTELKGLLANRTEEEEK